MQRTFGVNTYNLYQDMARREDLDIVTITTPHHLHLLQSKYFLENGVNVFCEKPPAVTIQRGREFVNARDQANKLVGVNYMNTAAESALALKELIDSGVLGEIKEIIGKGKWMRSDEYYERKAWAGQMMRGNEPLLDGCLFNQFPHLIEQCIYFVPGKEKTPILIEAELYRAHSSKVLQMEDTACFRTRVNDIDVFFYGSVCHPKDEDLTLEVVGTKGSATWDPRGYIVTYKNGTSENKQFITKENDHWEPACLRAYRNFVEAVQKNDPSHQHISLEDALIPTLLVNAAYMSSDGIRQIPDQYVYQENSNGGGESTGQQAEQSTKTLIHGTTVYGDYNRCGGISNIIDLAANKRLMFSGIVPPSIGGWAEPGLSRSLGDIEHFDVKLLKR